MLSGRSFTIVAPRQGDRTLVKRLVGELLDEHGRFVPKLETVGLEDS